jgi:hypothetical protein
MNIPIDFLKDCVRASVFDISRENISDPASIVKGVSSPSDFAIPMLNMDQSLMEGLRDSGLSRAWLSSNEDGSACNFTFSNHRENNSR